MVDGNIKFNHILWRILLLLLLFRHFYFSFPNGLRLWRIRFRFDDTNTQPILYFFFFILRDVYRPQKFGWENNNINFLLLLLPMASLSSPLLAVGRDARTQGWHHFLFLLSFERLKSQIVRSEKLIRFRPPPEKQFRRCSVSAGFREKTTITRIKPIMQLYKALSFF